MSYDGYLRLAQELGKQLHEIMGWDGPMTGRQFVVWQMWLAEQWNRPSLTDQYIMQLTAVVRQGQVKDPSRVDVDQFKIKYRTTTRQSDNGNEQTGNSQPSRISGGLTCEQATAMSQARWFGMMTAPIQGLPRAT